MDALALKARAASLQAHILAGSSAESSVIDWYFVVENVHECSLRYDKYVKCAANAQLRYKI